MDSTAAGLSTVGLVLVRPSVGGVLFPGSSRRSGSVTIHLCGLPVRSGARRHRWTDRPTAHCLTLLPEGVAEPSVSPSTLVRSYRTVSP